MLPIVRNEIMTYACRVNASARCFLYINKVYRRKFNLAIKSELPVSLFVQVSRSACFV